MKSMEPVDFVNFEPQVSFRKFVLNGYEKLLLYFTKPTKIRLSIKKMDFNYSAFGVIEEEQSTLVGYAFSQDPYLCLKQLFRQLEKQILDERRYLRFEGQYKESS